MEVPLQMKLADVMKIICKKHLFTHFPIENIFSSQRDVFNEFISKFQLSAGEFFDHLQSWITDNRIEKIKCKATEYNKKGTELQEEPYRCLSVRFEVPEDGGVCLGFSDGSMKAR